MGPSTRIASAHPSGASRRRGRAPAVFTRLFTVLPGPEPPHRAHQLGNDISSRNDHYHRRVSLVDIRPGVAAGGRARPPRVRYYDRGFRFDREQSQAAISPPSSASTQKPPISDPPPSTAEYTGHTIRTW
ncbi:hypothetical protein EVAR_96578_1 [Eumeta japonica]|uniref:Uncharacterized protein n=1 Tax=Eumeta variegata TaxID=151549 RepID=A0A4C1WST6_EUMVA|nr:hypothetical protein EVAR_96578_1 [Eumeta japonica]